MGRHRQGGEYQTGIGHASLRGAEGDEAISAMRK
jgi:hypothetical protein